ncbi:hypothetical protein [Escherichia coli]|uniref:hypothetical protein n=1 Tax=Escherichia coli TaxID=562 RepID=UPI001C5C0CF1|nr:hypothetical protein [Escherichia coli]
MNNDIVDSIPQAWMLLFDDYDFTQEHYNQLRNFSSEELHEIIAEMAGCHSSARSLLRNKWVTSPEDILSRLPSNMNGEYKTVHISEMNMMLNPGYMNCLVP